ncbi:MAG: arsenate reductase ArsC [Candidatus Thermoplasmatota archaeon]|nr:arsenate reductase ArsC [Candidatus Thermoplasmatota archaeon]
MKEKNYLFVYVENARGSMMSEAFARHMGMSAHRAGTVPSSSVNRMVVQAMGEKGIDPAHSKPRMFENNMIDVADSVTVMGCSLQDACPARILAPMQKKIVDWNLPVPQGKSLDEVRSIRIPLRKRSWNSQARKPEKARSYSSRAEYPV